MAPIQPKAATVAIDAEARQPVLAVGGCPAGLRRRDGDVVSDHANVRVVENRVGLELDAASSGNVLVDNTALANGQEDLEDLATPTTCIVCIPPG